MSSQLDILALEPFYGGVRRVMLETLIRCSRHRWTLLKLPPRRIERRLTAAAHWFSEQLSRHWIGRLDVLFTSEALNLSDLHRLSPALAAQPSVVYFHSNQLPDPGVPGDNPLDFVNLNTALAASEIWFNSLYHLKQFLARARSFIDRHGELSARNPLPDIAGKAQLVFPSIEYELQLPEGPAAPQRSKRTIFVETRDANIPLLNAALGRLMRRNEKFSLITVGPVEELQPDLPRRTLSEIDEIGQLRAYREAGIFLSAKIGAPCDLHAIRSIAAGCFPVCPETGVYREFIPDGLLEQCLYRDDADELANRLLDVWHLPPPDTRQLSALLAQYDPIVCSKAIDERLEQLAAQRK